MVNIFSAADTSVHVKTGRGEHHILYSKVAAGKPYYTVGVEIT